MFALIFSLNIYLYFTIILFNENSMSDGVLHDYTNDDGGHYYRPPDPDLVGIAILDDDQSILNTHPYLGDELAPRNQGIMKRQYFAVGANRKEGFRDGKEGFEARENFYVGPAGIPCANGMGSHNELVGDTAANDQRMRDRYIRGDFGKSDRGAVGVKSSREDWHKFENVDWNPRPPHFIADAPNKYSHVVLKQSERGLPTAYPDSSRMAYDRFNGGGPESPPIDSMTIRIVLFFIMILVICMWASYSIGYNIGKALGHFNAEIHHPASIPVKA